MKNPINPTALKIIIVFVLAFVAFSSCKKSEVEQIINPNSLNTIIDNIQPNIGNAGTTVTINGINFSVVSTENSVKFNGVESKVITSTTTQLTVIAPANATSGNVTVQVKSKPIASGPNFTFGNYPTLISVNPTTAKAGDQVTITGTNFSSVKTQNRVTFAATQSFVDAIIVSATTTTLVVEVPAAAVSGNIGVVTNGLSSTNNLPIVIQTSSSTGNISLFIEQNPSGIVDKYAVDLNGNVYATFNGGPFLNVRGVDGVVKKTFASSDFNTNTGVIGGLGKDIQGNVCVALIVYGRGQSNFKETTFFRIKPDFTSEIIGSPVLEAISVSKLFAVDASNNIFYTDSFSIFKIENSKIDLTKRYIDGRTYPSVPYTLDFKLDITGNLYVLTSKPISAGNSKNIQSVIKYDTNKNATTVYTVQTTTLDRTKFDAIPSATLGEFRSLVITTDNSILVGDFDGNRVRKIVGDDKTEILAGSGDYAIFGGTYLLKGPKLSTPLPHPLYLDYDRKNNKVFSKPDGYDKGIFVQAFTL